MYPFHNADNYAILSMLSDGQSMLRPESYRNLSTPLRAMTFVPLNRDPPRHPLVHDLQWQLISRGTRRNWFTKQLTSFASSTRPSSKRSCTTPRVADSRAEKIQAWLTEVCSPTLREGRISFATPSCRVSRNGLQDVVGMSLMVLWHVPFVLSNVRRCPRSGLVRVQTPADSVVGSSVLLSGDRSVNLLHGSDDHVNVILLREGLERGPDAGGVTGEHRTGTSPVQVVCRITGGTDAWQIGGTTTSVDRVRTLLPESTFVKQLVRTRSAIVPYKWGDILTATLQA